MSYDYSVQYLYDLMKRGKIVLEVPFQRKQIWKSDKSSSLIESIIMNVPIPPLYFAEEENGNWLVLDGLQRLSSIKDFYDNEYALTKLEVLTELNKRKYKDLPPKSRSLLDDGAESAESKNFPRKPKKGFPGIFISFSDVVADLCAVCLCSFLDAAKRDERKKQAGNNPGLLHA